MHRVNAGLVLRALVTAGATSRQQIVRETTLGKATVSRVVRDLIDSGLVVEGSLVKGPDGGRATRTLEFRGGQELVCGVDMGGTNTRLVVVDQRAGLVAAWRQPTAHLAGGPNIADWLVDALHAGCPDVVRHGLAATVVGVPGAVVPGSGEIAQAPNLTEVEGTGFARRLGELLPGHVAVRNDSNLALVGEMGAGAAAGFHDVAMITVGTGVGTGVAVGGELLTGARGLIGEFGSLPIALERHGRGGRLGRRRADRGKDSARVRRRRPLVVPAQHRHSDPGHPARADRRRRVRGVRGDVRGV